MALNIAQYLKSAEAVVKSLAIGEKMTANYVRAVRGERAKLKEKYAFEKQSCFKR